MHRHELDTVSLFTGVSLVIVAGGYTVTHITGVRLQWLVAVPALLVLIGSAVIVSVVRRMRHSAYDGSAAHEAADVGVIECPLGCARMPSSYVT
jgi:hypothetical protein